MLQYVHDYRLANKALWHLTAARRLLAVECLEDALVRIDEARIALDKYVCQENVCPVEEGEKGWVKMDDALQLTFSRYQLELVHEFFCQYLGFFPDALLANDFLSVVNRCRELLQKPGFADVQELIDNKANNK